MPANKPKAKSRSRARVPAAAGTADEEEPEPKPKTKSKSKPKEPVEPKPQRPYFNPLPKAPKPVRPAAQAFVWGAGNFGQFGMGPDRLGEYDKPTRNKWVQEQIEDGVFGVEGAGIESIAAGGLHTVSIDEKGTVRFFQVHKVYRGVLLGLSRSGLAVSTMTLRSGVSLRTSPTRASRASSLTSTRSRLSRTQSKISSSKSSGRSKSSQVTTSAPPSATRVN
jgi:hypothetical protein